MIRNKGIFNPGGNIDSRTPLVPFRWIYYTYTKQTVNIHVGRIPKDKIFINSGEFNQIIENLIRVVDPKTRKTKWEYIKVSQLFHL